MNNRKRSSSIGGGKHRSVGVPVKYEPYKLGRSQKRRPASAPDLNKPSRESVAVQHQIQPGHAAAEREDDSRRIMPNENPVQSHRLEAFRLALERIQELQQSVEDDSSSFESDDEYDLRDHLESIVGPDIAARAPKIEPETLGFLVCAQETMAYLCEQGLAGDDPVVLNLKKRLMEGIERI